MKEESLNNEAQRLFIINEHFNYLFVLYKEMEHKDTHKKNFVCTERNNVLENNAVLLFLKNKKFTVIKS